jgi:hypothetical protein
VKVMFLDESGNHDLNKVNPNYPVFVLGGVIVDRAHLRNTIEPELQQFKMKHFGRTDVILHTVAMGKGRGDYAFLADPTNRATFYMDLNAVLLRWDYQVVACVFELPRYVAQFTSTTPADPYRHGLEILIERFCEELGEELDAGFVCAEKRNPGLDRELMDAWQELRTNAAGTGSARSQEIDSKIIDLSLKDKRLNMAGLQLADMVVTPPGRHVAGRPPNPNQVQWTVVEKKLRRVEGAYIGAGLTILP